VNVYPRDHSFWQHRPGTTHGAHALHSPSATDAGLAACSSRIVLDDQAGTSADRYPDLLCKRSGCVAARRPRSPETGS
jgi:hypothetical protein